MDPFDPFDPTPPGGDGRRLDRLLVWVATAGAFGCSVLIFLATNVSDPDPVAEPVPTTSALPAAASSTITSTTTTTEPAASTTTTTAAAPPPVTTTTPPPRTTVRRTTTTNRPVTTTTTNPPPTTSRHRCAAASWQRDTAYSGGQVVSFGGRLWVAKWWNYNAVPGENAEGVWVPAQSC